MSTAAATKETPMHSKESNIVNQAAFYARAKELDLFYCGIYSSGPSKAHFIRGDAVFQSGLMTNPYKKAGATEVTKAINVAALYGWAIHSGATKVNQFLALVFQKLTSESLEVCEIAASLTAIAMQWAEFDKIEEHPEIIRMISGGRGYLFDVMFEQLLAARKL